MKNIFSLAIIIMAVTYCQNAWAVYDFCDFSAVAPSGQRLYFMYNYQNGGVKIVSPSSHYNYVTGDLVIPASVSYYGSTYAVTKIEQNAFSSCPGLNSVTIPNSVISIGNSAFSGCSNLTSVDYTGTIAQWCNIDFFGPSSNPVYYSHSLNISGSPVTNLAITDGVTEIKPFAFYNCSSMTSVTMPSSVTTIGNHAFFGCTSLYSMTLPDSNTTIGNYAFSGCTSLSSITLSGDNTSIGSSSFSGCTSLSTITLSGDNTSIGHSSFSGCTSLSTITLSGDNTSIGSSAFSGCTSLSNITLSGNNTSIGSSAFSGCTSLSNITLSGNNTSIGSSAFYGCTNLTSVDYNGTIAQWCNIDFSSETSNPVYYSHSLNISGSPVTNLTIPDGVTEIKPFVFYYCSSLTSVTIPSSVTTIGNYAFYGCSGLTTVDYTGTIVQWCNIDFSGYYANPVYYSHSLNINGSSLNINDSSVTNLVIPNSVTSIGDNAFANCTALTFVTIPNSVTSIGTDAFYNVRHIEYYGNATGSPWGANSWNGIIDGDFVYADATKHKLLAYIGTGSAVTIPSIVDTIGNYAFRGCSGLTSVTIPSSVKSIGHNAFYGCSGLTSITIPSSVKSIGYNAFYGCSGLTSIYINYGVTSISSSAFSGCTSLSSITIPSSVTSIGSGAFSGCTSLSSITIPSSVTSIGSSAFSGCTSLSSITLPNSITSIEASAFNNCTALTSVNIPSGALTIGNSAFNGCTALTSVNYAGINYAFSIAGWCNIDFSDERSNPVYYSHSLKINGCSVTELVIPNNVTKIKAYAFVKCSSLTTVSIPSSVTSIGYFAFDGCSGLSSVTIPSSVTTINNYAFRNVRHIEYYGNATGSPWGAKSMNGVMEGDFVYSDITKHYLQKYVGDGGAVSIPSMVDTIGNNAFYGCVGLTSIAIPYGVSSISNYAFSGCTNLSFINIPGTVTSIGYYAFYNCVSMTTASIGNSVTNIGCGAFAGCSSLSMVYCMAPPPTIDASTFDPTVNFYVPCNYVTNYRSTTYWENHSLRIHGTLQMEYNYSFTPSNDAFGDVRVGVMDCDSNITVTAVANIGHQFIGWSDGGTDNPRIFHITSDTMLTAFFDYITYSIGAQASDSIYGTVTVNGNFRYGDTVILTASANYGYHFLRWSDNNTENPRTVVVSQNASYTAYFEPNNYIVNVLSDNIVQGTISGGGAITYLDTCCISAIPATNYHFSHWTDGDSNASRCFMVEEGITLIAYFEINRHQLIVLPNDSTLGTVTGSGIYDYGTEVTVSAISAPGSRFIRWNDNSQLASRTVTLTEDMQLMAIFMPVDTVIVHDTSYVDVHDTTYVNVPYAVHDTTYIDVHDTTYIDVPYAVHDTTIVVDTITLTEYVPVHDTTYIDIHDTTFVPVHDTAYVNVHDTTFITLTDTVTNTVYDTITNTVFDTVTNTIYDTTIVYSTDTLWLHDTVFVHDTIFIYDTIYVGVDEVETISAKIYTSNGQIIVDGTQGNTVWLFDVNGRVLATKQDEYSPLHFDVPASGAYMVKIGDHTARKVVVIK